MKSSCSCNLLLLSSANVTTPGPSYDVMWDHSKSTYWLFVSLLTRKCVPVHWDFLSTLFDLA